MIQEVLIIRLVFFASASLKFEKENYLLDLIHSTILVAQRHRLLESLGSMKSNRNVPGKELWGLAKNSGDHQKVPPRPIKPSFAAKGKVNKQTDFQTSMILIFELVFAGGVK